MLVATPGRLMDLLNQGNTKDALLPVPVWAQPRKSLPAKTTGMACS
jgi:hypothetical protein